MMEGIETIKIFDISERTNSDMGNHKNPTYFCTWNNSTLTLSSGDSHFGFVYSGEITLTYEEMDFTLKEGMYFCVPGKGFLKGTGSGFVASRIDVKCYFMVGGPVESEGRLKYINGCSDSLLIQPVLKGYPCFNFLHIPANVNQTAHTHPSVRIGLIISGQGICTTPNGNLDLLPGKIFILPEDSVHSFHTRENFLRIVVYHPDSDFGPTNDDHPMLNRTIIDGVSAKRSQGSQ
jgi:quercetin dioxygenase-like cupin family protein